MWHALVALGFTLLVGVALYPAYISVLSRLHLGQRVHAYSPRTHAVKAGTPTMGGLLFCALLVAAWLLLDRSRSGFVAVFAVLAGGALGMADDIANVRGVGVLGLPGRQKLLIQALIGGLVGFGLLQIGATHQLIPFFGAPNLGVAIIPIAALAVVAASNAVNLTDGVDGLAATCSLIAMAALLVVALHLHAVAAIVISAAACGGLAAFLVFNWFPARIFMGDTGSLALGCVLVVLSCELRLLWMLPILGIVFVAETLSVIINVTAIRRFKRRVFRSSPLHHHFEDMGWRERRLVAGFAIAALVGACLVEVYALRAVVTP